MNEEAEKEVVPVCLYHEKDAPGGKVFQSDDMPKGKGWVDTPAKFKGSDKAE